MAGLYFEQFSEGQEFEHAWSRTVTEMDNTMFSLLTMNPQPLHLDAHFSAQTEWGQRLFNSLYTLGILVGMSVNDTTLGTTIANLGMSDVRFRRSQQGVISRTCATCSTTRRLRCATGTGTAFSVWPWLCTNWRSR